jgi:hypothetical protein
MLFRPMNLSQKTKNCKKRIAKQYLITFFSVKIQIKTNSWYTVYYNQKFINKIKVLCDTELQIMTSLYCRLETNLH